MKTKKIKRPVCYLVGLLAFGLMLYSCLQDETDLDSQETTGKVIKGKNRELSIDVARSWYEARQTPVVTTRSVVTHFELMTKLHWKKGYENRKGKFEVVEVPLLTRGGAVLMDRETMEKYKDTERGKIRNISRMVIIKNLETGEIINFVMHIVGTYDYLMKAKHFEDNSYLYRAPDLSGSVYFYEPEGALVNGWQYKDGKIVATISQGTEEGSSMQDTIDTRGIVLKPVCHTESVYVEHNECNGFPIRIRNTVLVSVLNAAKWESGKQWKYVSKYPLMKKMVILADNGIPMKTQVEVWRRLSTTINSPQS